MRSKEAVAPRPSPARQFVTRHWAPALVVVILTAYCRILFFRGDRVFFFAGDSSRLFYEALLWKRGLIPYRDAFEFAQPGALFFFRCVAAIFGWNLTAYAISLSACVVVAGLALQRAARQLITPALSVVATAGVLELSAAVPTYHWLAPILLVVACALLTSGRNKWTDDFFAGVLSGAAFFTMQSEGAAGLLLFAAYLLLRRREALRRFLCGALVPAVVVLGYFLLQHSLREYFDCTFVFALTRVSKGTWQGGNEWLREWRGHAQAGSRGIYLGSLLAFVLINVLAVSAIVRKQVPQACKLLAGLTIAMSVAVAYGLNMGRIFPAMMVGFPVVLWWISTKLSSKWTVAIAGTLIALLLWVRVAHLLRRPATELTSRLGGEQGILLPDSARDTYLFAKASWFCAHTEPGDVIAMYPWQTDVALLCDVSNGARFQWLDEGGFNTPAEVAKTVEQLKRTAPVVGGWEPILDDAGRQIPPRILLPMTSFLESCYSTKERVGDSILYSGPNASCFHRATEGSHADQH